jgi:hypothetical protein
MPGGPTLSGNNGILPPNGTPFALLQSAYAFGVTSSGADTTTDAQGATLTFVNNPGPGLPPTYALSVPGLGLNNVPVTATTLSGGAASLFNLDYAYFGTWDLDSTADAFLPNEISAVIGGYQTPLSGMPTSGQATYAGTMVGFVAAPEATAGSYSAHPIGGTAAMSVDFASGALTGAVTVANVYLGSPTGIGVHAWNDMQLNGTISGAAFTGTATALAPGTLASNNIGNPAYLLPTGSTGPLTGKFFGPNAENAAAVWSVSSASSGVAVGAIGVARSSGTPSDRRLKRDVTFSHVTPAGLRIHRYRYWNDPHWFEGVIAQELLETPHFADAVFRSDTGFLVVDYDRLGLRVPEAERMYAVGWAAIASYVAAGA